MSILPSQTLVNEDISFYALNSAQGVVTTVTQGSNIIITGTSTDPIISAVGAVTSLTEGSNIDITGTSNVPIISAVGASINNVSRYGSKTATLAAPVLSNGFVSLFTIAPTYFSDANSSYLLTASYQVTSAECSNVTGGLGIQVNLGNSLVGTSFIPLNSQSTWTNLSNVPNEAVIARTFLPSQFPGSNLSFLFVNNTNGTFSNASLAFDISITSLTTSNISNNNWT